DLPGVVSRVRVQVEPIRRYGSQLELPTLVAGVEVAEILRRGRRIEVEEVAVGRFGVEERQARDQPPVKELALGADFPGVGDLGLEDVMNALLSRGRGHGADA